MNYYLFFRKSFCLIFFFILFLTAKTSHCLDYDPFDEFTDTMISMDVKDATLDDILKSLSKKTGLNFITSAKISKNRINFYLNNVSVKDALERILFAYDLTYEMDPKSNIIIIKSIASPRGNIITKIYKLKYAAVPSSKINNTFSNQNDIFTISALAPQSGITNAINALLTENGSIVEDVRTNSLIISDVPSQFPLIEKTIKELDVPVPQILIEVEMLDISKATADLLGAKIGSTPITFTGASKETFFPFNTNEPKQYSVGTLSFEGLKFSLQFLRTRSDTKNLARPRILTLNNETAEIQIKTNEAIGLASRTITAEGTASSVEEAERAYTGIFLKVTPQANIETKEITIALEPKVIQSKEGDSFGGQSFKDPEERGTKSILRISDGDTITIGGLLRTDISEIRTKVPFFSKIPILGLAFRHKDKTETERELIIFITPHIVEEKMFSNIESDINPRVNDISIKKLNEINKEFSRIQNPRE